MTDAGWRAFAGLADSIVLFVVALVFIDARPALLVGVAALTLVLLTIWTVTQRGLAARRWVRGAKQLDPGPVNLEPAFRTVVRRLMLLPPWLGVELGLVWLAAAILDFPELVAGVLVGTPGPFVWAANAVWLNRWQQREGHVLLRERSPSGEDDDEYFLAVRVPDRLV